jgi:hypothetical protein
MFRKFLNIHLLFCTIDDAKKVQLRILRPDSAGMLDGECHGKLRDTTGGDD